MLKKLTLSSFVLGFFLLVGMASAASAQSYETEVKYGVNFRTAPSLSGDIIRMLSKGEDIHVIERYNDYWLKIETKDGKIGYISDNEKYSNFSSTTPIDDKIVTTGYPWFRSEPNIGSSKYGSIPKGTTLTALSTITNGYVKVAYNGKKGWIYVDYINFSNSSSSTSSSSSSSKASWEIKADAIIATAKSYIGKVTYSYGKRNYSSLTLDCSSFTELVFEKHGISMKWGTRYQKNMGSYVSKSNLRKGDLVFFDTTGNGSINHVGIYIGNDQFIENGPNHGVKITDLDGFWDDAYVTARRVI